jgi:hypothetical protein
MDNTRFQEVMEEARHFIKVLVCDGIVCRDELLAQLQAIEEEEVNKELEEARIKKERARMTTGWWVERRVQRCSGGGCGE